MNKVKTLYSITGHTHTYNHFIDIFIEFSSITIKKARKNKTEKECGSLCNCCCLISLLISLKCRCSEYLCE